MVIEEEDAGRHRTSFADASRRVISVKAAVDPDLEPLATPPPPPAEGEGPDEAAAAPAKPRRWPLVALLLVVIAVGAAAVTVVLTRDEKQTPEDVLAGAVKFASANKDASFTGRLRLESKDTEAGGSFVDRLNLAGTARLPDQAHYTITGDGFASEIVAIGEVLYVKDAEKREQLAAKKWAKVDLAEEDDRAGVIRDEGLAGGADEIGDPVGLLRTLGAARNPQLVSRSSHQTVIKAEIDPAKAYGSAVASEVDKATVELTVGKDDRIDRAVLSATGTSGSVSADYEFKDWGQAVRIAAPPKNDLDPTPGIEEEDVAAFKDAKLFMPRGIPAGWVLDGASVLPKEQTAENCEQVELDYIDPDDPDAGFLYLYELPKKCADLTPPRGASAFKAGRYSGYADEDQDGAMVQIVVGDTVVQAETDLPLDGLARILADLVPLDLKVQPNELTGFEQTSSA